MMNSVEDRIEMICATRDKVSIDLIPSTSVASVTCSAIFWLKQQNKIHIYTKGIFFFDRDYKEIEGFSFSFITSSCVMVTSAPDPNHFWLISSNTPVEFR